MLQFFGATSKKKSKVHNFRNSNLNFHYSKHSQKFMPLNLLLDFQNMRYHEKSNLNDQGNRKKKETLI